MADDAPDFRLLAAELLDVLEELMEDEGGEPRKDDEASERVWLEAQRAIGHARRFIPSGGADATSDPPVSLVTYIEGGRAFTPEAVLAYVRSGGDVCPHCGAKEAIGSNLTLSLQRQKAEEMSIENPLGFASTDATMGVYHGLDVVANAGCCYCGFAFLEVYELRLVRIEPQPAEWTP